MTNPKIPPHIEQAVATDGVVVLDASASDQETLDYLRDHNFFVYYAHSLRRPAITVAVRGAVALEDRIQRVTGIAVHHLEPFDDTFPGGQ